MKTATAFIFGALIGFGLCVLIARQAISESMQAEKISHLYLPISDFLTFNKVSSVEEYCIKLKMFKDDISLIKKEIEMGNRNDYISGVLPLVSDYASGTVQAFENLEKEDMRYNCDEI